jgi:hypothetical protein
MLCILRNANRLTGAFSLCLSLVFKCILIENCADSVSSLKLTLKHLPHSEQFDIGRFRTSRLILR